MRGQGGTGGILLLLCGWVQAAEPTQVEALRNAGEAVGTGSLLQMLAGLAVILGLILGMAWFMRRLGGLPGTGGGALKVLGGVSLGQRERVVLLQAGDKQLLIGVAPGQIRTLHVLDEPIVTGSPEPAAGFAARLEAVMKRGGGK